MSYIISIDGPAGSGKSSLVIKLKEILGIRSVDTGMMYRAVALYFLENNIDINDVNKVKESLDYIKIKIAPNKNKDNASIMYLNNVDVTDKLRTEIISSLSSKVSGIKEVRLAMTIQQREYAKQESIVMDGRDIGSVVFPNADVKIFLTADIAARSKRRYEDLIKAGEKITLEEVRENMSHRDAENIERSISPLIKTDDMIEIDTTNIGIDEVVNKVMDIVRLRGLIK